MIRYLTPSNYFGIGTRVPLFTCKVYIAEYTSCSNKQTACSFLHAVDVFPHLVDDLRPARLSGRKFRSFRWEEKIRVGGAEREREEGGGEGRIQSWRPGTCTCAQGWDSCCFLCFLFHKEAAGSSFRGFRRLKQPIRVCEGDPI